MFDLSGHVALVTGGSRGIGSSICRHLARQGAAVAANYHQSEQQAHALRKEIEDAGGRAIVGRGDVRVPEDTERVVQETIDGPGRVDDRVSNAGLNRDASLVG